MRRRVFLGGIVLALLLVLGISLASASVNVYPEKVEVFELITGHTCVIYDGVFQECYCPCEVAECEECEYENTPTPTPKNPTVTPTPKPTITPQPECKIWLCHKPGTEAEQDYCCWDSEGCKSAHLAHGDYLGKCKP